MRMNSTQKYSSILKYHKEILRAYCSLLIYLHLTLLQVPLTPDIQKKLNAYTFVHKYLLPAATPTPKLARFSCLCDGHINKKRTQSAEKGTGQYLEHIR